MKLYGHAKATCTLRVMMLLEELQVPYELVPIDLMKGEHKQPEYLKLQPFGKIPALVDDDFTIFESRCILRYLAKKYSDKLNLYGTDLKEQTLVDNWLEVEGQNYNGPISSIVYEKVFKKWSNRETDEEAVTKNLESLNHVLDVYDRVLSTRDYVAGDNFSIADISHVSYAHYLVEVAGLKEPFENHPYVNNWYKRLTTRPSWKNALSKN